MKNLERKTGSWRSNSSRDFFSLAAAAANEITSSLFFPHHCTPVSGVLTHRLLSPSLHSSAMQCSAMLRGRAMPAAGVASTSRAAQSRASALRVSARTQVLEEGRAPKESRVGKVPITVPSGVNVTLENAYIKVKVSEREERGAREKELKRKKKTRRRGDAAWSDKLSFFAHVFFLFFPR